MTTTVTEPRPLAGTFTTQHRMTWTVDHWGRLTGRAHCDAPEDADCRLTCAEDCGAEEWPCRTGDRVHGMKDSGECLAIVWLNEADDMFDIYDGPKGRDVDLAPGPIVLEWQSDTYVWRFPDKTRHEYEPADARLPDTPDPLCVCGRAWDDFAVHVDDRPADHPDFQQ